MTARQIRELEIKEMMESFDQEQTYEKYQKPQEEEEEEEEEEEVEAKANDGYRQLNIPVSHSVNITSSSKTISSVSLDPSNTRLMCGSVDNGLRCYNFSGMDSSHKPFRDVIPDDGSPIVCLDGGSVLGKGDKILVCTSSAQPRVLDRDAKELKCFVKGDVYITDVTKTKGHTAAVTGGMWDPKEKDRAMTCGMDGSVRLWKLDGKTLFGKLICDQVFRVRNKRGVRAPCTAASFDKEGAVVVFGTQCGSVQSFSTSAFHVNTPVNCDHDAHTSTITCIKFSPDNSFFATRSMDSTVNLYSFAAFSKPGKNCPPLKTIRGIETSYEFANLCFSPDSSMLLAGTCVNPKKSEASFLHFYPTSKETTEPIASIASLPSISTPVVEWAPKINQIITGSSDGKVRVLYDPTLSNKGVLLSASRKPRKVNALDALLLSRGDNVTGEIFNPHALPIFQTKKDDKKSKEKRSRDRMPENARTDIMMGRGDGTKTNTQSMVDNLGISKTDVRLLSRDPRTDLFKFIDKNPTGVKTGMNAYDTEKPLLASTTAEEEQAKRKVRTTNYQTNTSPSITRLFNFTTPIPTQQFNPTHYNPFFQLASHVAATKTFMNLYFLNTNPTRTLVSSRRQHIINCRKPLPTLVHALRLQLRNLMLPNDQLPPQVFRALQHSPVLGKELNPLLVLRLVSLPHPDVDHGNIAFGIASLVVLEVSELRGILGKYEPPPPPTRDSNPRSLLLHPTLLVAVHGNVELLENTE
jgi:WD40 repeat protein